MLRSSSAASAWCGGGPFGRAKSVAVMSATHFFVALACIPDLLKCAKHLFVAAATPVQDLRFRARVLLKDAKSAAASQLRAPAFKRWRSSLKPLSSCCLTRARRRRGARGRDRTRRLYARNVLRKPKRADCRGGGVARERRQWRHAALSPPNGLFERRDPNCQKSGCARLTGL
jgi:hypothetical protein